jgi:N,N-dimethylformamidase
MGKLRIRGYCDAPSAAPGETVRFYVSCDDPGEYQADVVRLIHGDTNPKGPGFKEELVETSVSGTYPARLQRTQVGGYVEAPDHGALHPTGGLTVHAFVWSATPTRGRQGIVSRWADDVKAGWALTLEDGALLFSVGDGSGTVGSVASDRPLFNEVWYSVAASYDPDGGTLTLRQQSVVNRVNSVFGPIVALDSDTTVTASSAVAPADAGVPAIIAGLAESAAGDRIWCIANYNGKIDAPKVYGRSLTETEAARLAAGESVTPGDLLASWDFATGIGPGGIPTDRVVDVSGNGIHGRCVNQPDRAMTGWNWQGLEEHFVHAPEQYGAMWFHEDSLDDCRWQVDFELTVPESMRSGVYAARLRMGEAEDHVPFFVLPPRGAATAKILFLVPTCSYLAYANSQITQTGGVAQSIIGHTPPLNQWDVELHERPEYGLSTYDSHVDGQGVAYTSWRRPILQMRPRYRHEYGAIHQFPADLYLVDWLAAQGFEYDVATDHDLITEGVDLLKRYTVVLTSTHPEYYTAGMVDAWEDYLCAGGRGMYLGANGIYWIVSLHPEKPWVMEVRKGETGAAAWKARPGELHHSTTGERGGLWRHRARPPQKIWGTGFSTFGFDHSGYFVQMPDALDERVAWIMDGIDPEETIGDFGLVGGGAAGWELDRYDRSLGTPPNSMLLASSVEHSVNYYVVNEDIFFPHPGMSGGEHPLVRGDVVYFTTRDGGAVFSASSIAWCGSLSWNDYDNNVSRMMKNVLTRFERDEPLPAI